LGKGWLRGPSACQGKKKIVSSFGGGEGDFSPEKKRPTSISKGKEKEKRNRSQLSSHLKLRHSNPMKTAWEKEGEGEMKTLPAPRSKRKEKNPPSSAPGASARKRKKEGENQGSKITRRQDLAKGKRGGGGGKKEKPVFSFLRPAKGIEREKEGEKRILRALGRGILGDALRVEKKRKEAIALQVHGPQGREKG